MPETDDDRLAGLEWSWSGLAVKDDEAAELTDALKALRRGLDAIMSEELRNTEPPLLFRVDAPLR